MTFSFKFSIIVVTTKGKDRVSSDKGFKMKEFNDFKKSMEEDGIELIKIARSTTKERCLLLYVEYVFGKIEDYKVDDQGCIWYLPKNRKKNASIIKLGKFYYALHLVANK